MSGTTVGIKRSVGATICTLALLGMAACGGDQGSPEDLGKAVAEAINNEDVDAMKELTCEEKRSEVSETAMEEAKKTLEQAGIKDPQVSAEFVKAEEKGDEASVTLKIKVDNLPEEMKQAGAPESQEQTFKAVQKDGDWVVCE